MKQLKVFLKLISNELYKTFFQIKTIVFICLMVALVGLVAYLSVSTDKGDKWRDDTQKQIETIKKSISETESKKDKDEFDITMLNFEKDQFKVLEYRLQHNIPGNAITPLRFVYSCSELMVLIVLFMAIFASNIVANEYSQGTIRQLLVKPIKRWKIFIAKYLSAVLVSMVLTMILFIVSLALGFILFQKNSNSIYDVVLVNGNIVERNMLSHILAVAFSKLFSISIISALAFFISTIVRTTGLAIIASLGIYFAGFVGGIILNKYPLYKFFITPNLDLHRYLPGESLPYAGATFTFSIVVCIVYLMAFLASGLIVFNKRDVF
ncbi:ABC transporter permease [Pseudobacteroides cellulosolvens]|uniref:ABC transporter permease n=1 Tax=Pseudobacteroides cellulosolvens ATCC 35603 = DSM 2933 TaxID=398512 RepID=A0A0L6JXZ9_9FIRM|nr:ABC transporter permease subunit [Pseudobacteroides cellulosolvens]KNY30327.1 hypothetical protein Bccel_5607 [Pseudobacteroides cellulosolvens ATCC 35603 = DSM 2933]